MNIDELTEYLNNRARAIELISWLRDKDLLENNYDDPDEIELAEEYAFDAAKYSASWKQSDRAILAKIKSLLKEDR